MIEGQIRHEMMKEVRGLSGTPCGDRRLDECFTRDEGTLILWYNDAAGSTHVIKRELPPKLLEKVRTRAFGPRWPHA